MKGFTVHILLQADTKVYNRKRELIRQETEYLMKGWTTAPEIEKRAVARLVNELTDHRSRNLFKED
jgi:hypothetical protein